jgi:outer membrane receptor for ferrienterochelin and colicins
MIGESPVKVEVLGADEIMEDATEKPSNMTQVLTETAGIGSQQTSANSGNISIKIQGLDGKYTQILKDGFPVFGGFFSGLSLMQVPPLDLKQVELIKGSSSSLYGSDAIAGIINLVSKLPGNEEELTVLANINQKKGGDLDLYFSEKFNDLGFTFLSNNTLQMAVDVNNDGFSDISEVRTFVLNPKFLFDINENSSLILGLNGIFEKRIGGDMTVLASSEPDQSFYSETNESKRFFYHLKYENKIDEDENVIIKNSISFFDRMITVPGYLFSGKQLSSYTEMSYLFRLSNHMVVSGINLNTDSYNDNSGLNRDFDSYLVGMFAQDDWRLRKDLTGQFGARLDYHKNYGLIFIPKISLKYDLNENIFSRVSLGTGYRRPTIFDSESESLLYQNILPISESVHPEKSVNVNLDIDYRVVLPHELMISMNQAFFFTSIKDPVLLDSGANTQYRYYSNFSGYNYSSGAESNFRINYERMNLFLAYTYTNSYYKFPEKKEETTFNPSHRLIANAMYEIEGVFKAGIEAFFLSRQYVGNGEYGRAYWLFGFIIEKNIEHFSFILNCENATNVMQSNFGQTVLPPRESPKFLPLYAPIDGIMLNFLIKYNYK